MNLDAIKYKKLYRIAYRGTTMVCTVTAKDYYDNLVQVETESGDKGFTTPESILPLKNETKML